MTLDLYNAGIGFWRGYDEVYRFHQGIERLLLLLVLVLLGMRCIFASASSLQRNKKDLLTLLVLGI